MIKDEQEEVGQDEEAQDAKLNPHGVRPTSEEVEKHNATHLPFRTWCPFCVAGKAKNEPHYKSEEHKPMGVNVVSIDYAFMGDTNIVDEADEEASDEESEIANRNSQNMPILVMRCRKTKFIFARVVPRKGRHPYTVRRVGQDISAILGYKRVVIKSDQEPAIKKLKAQVRLEFDLEVPDEESMAYDSQSNAEAEISIQVVQGQIRTLKAQLEHRIGQAIAMDSPILPWLVMHAGANLNRFSQGKDGYTAHRRLRGRAFNRPVTEFGECVWYYKPNKKQRGKIEPRWADGVFLGIREESGEVIIGTSEGVFKCRAFRRKGSEAERWNTAEITSVVGLPWQPVPGGPGMDLRSAVRVPEGEPIGRMPETQVREYKSRRFQIRKHDLRKHGLTIGCDGCDNFLKHPDKKGINHSEACRDRLSQALGAEGDPRVLAEAESYLEGSPDIPPAAGPDDLAPDNLVGEDMQGIGDDMSVVDNEELPLAGELLQLTASEKVSAHFGRWEKQVTSQWKGRGKTWGDGVAEMEYKLNAMDITSHVSEIYSPPRVTGLAEKMGLIRGVALDLSVPDPDDGKPWDFNDASKRKKAVGERYMWTYPRKMLSQACAGY